MKVAFYAPLKPPDHASPSGDRRIARLFMQALAGSGHEVMLASRFRAREGRGDVARQWRLRALGERLAARLLRRLRALPVAERPALWFTYHLYYKAPDWLGPRLADGLGIPYVVAEASHAPKRDRPPWRMVHRAAAAAIARADLVLTLNSDDLGCLRQVVADPRRVRRLAPFIDVAAATPAAPREVLRRRCAARHGLDVTQPWLVCAAMMRDGDKLASYRLLATALAALASRPWQLLVIGDGEAEAQVRAALAGLGARVFCVGRQAPEALPDLLGACDVYVWPAINEAFGMALIEAQAAALPVVAGATRGVPDVVADGETGLLVPLGDGAGLAAAVARLLDDPALREKLGAAARRRCERVHALPGAARRLDTLLAGLLRGGGP